MTPAQIDALQEVLEMAKQPHRQCDLHQDEVCEAEQYGDGNHEEHATIRETRAALDALKAAPSGLPAVVVVVDGGIATVHTDPQHPVEVYEFDLDSIKAADLVDLREYREMVAEVPEAFAGLRRDLLQEIDAQLAWHAEHGEEVTA